MLWLLYYFLLGVENNVEEHSTIIQKKKTYYL